MLDHRLQILITKDQRRRLDEAARERGASVGELVREAIDERYRGPSRAERIKAAEEIARMRAGPIPSPAELNRLFDTRFEDRARRAGLIDD